jgi:hypothetical protein
MRRCPFAPYGLASDFMAACPGFEPSRLDMGEGPGAGLTGQTCRHIGSGTTARGFVAICLHPEAERVVAAARRIVWTPSRAPEAIGAARDGVDCAASVRRSPRWADSSTGPSPER